MIRNINEYEIKSLKEKLNEVIKVKKLLMPNNLREIEKFKEGNLNFKEALSLYKKVQSSSLFLNLYVYKNFNRDMLNYIKIKLNNGCSSNIEFLEHLEQYINRATYDYDYYSNMDEEDNEKYVELRDSSIDFAFDFFADEVLAKKTDIITTYLSELCLSDNDFLKKEFKLYLDSPELEDISSKKGNEDEIYDDFLSCFQDDAVITKFKDYEMPKSYLDIINNTLQRIANKSDNYISSEIFIHEGSTYLIISGNCYISVLDVNIILLLVCNVLEVEDENRNM